MSGISIECMGTAGVRIDRQLSGENNSAYLSQGESASIDKSLFAQATVAEAGEPEISLSNDTDDRRLDIYSVRDGQTTRQRPLAPRRVRTVSLAAADRLLLIPLAIPAQTRSQRP
jgi:hypothetical protein